MSEHVVALARHLAVWLNAEQIRTLLNRHSVWLLPGVSHGRRGYAVQSGKLTLDLSNMRAVQLGARGIATIEAGAKLGPIHLVR